jgi:rhomboid family GlyGly-CTERM serine protease
LLNAVGLGLIAALFPREYPVRSWLLILASSIVTIDLGFVLLEPQLQWYVGLSGVLHGALAAGALGWWRHESKPLALGLTLVLVGKLAWEQWHGALPLSGDMPVVVDAHLYGAIGGALAGAWLAVHNRAPSAPNR